MLSSFELSLESLNLSVFLSKLSFPDFLLLREVFAVDTVIRLDGEFVLDEFELSLNLIVNNLHAPNICLEILSPLADGISNIGR